ncbi:MAG: carbohydrate ABC transporter permease [Planctomycetota bacterium]
MCVSTPGLCGNAFSIFLVYLFLQSIPVELEEAAQRDGCSAWTCFTHIALPLSKPAIAEVALLHCTFMWNDFLAPLVFLMDRDMFTVAVRLHFYQSRAGQTPWTLLMAASVLTMLPVLMIFVLALRTFSVSTSAFRHASPEARSAECGLCLLL